MYIDLKFSSTGTKEEYCVCVVGDVGGGGGGGGGG